MTDILTNNTDASIILTLANGAYSDPSFLTLGPGESVLYSDVLVLDTTNLNYNYELLQEYINSGVLLFESVAVATKGSELDLLAQGNLAINLTSGVPELIAKSPAKALTDNTQILPVTDSSGKPVCIYYKSPQGVSISLDASVSQVLISNANLLFPDEITSMAVQAYDSEGGTLRLVKRLFIGTLREGVKTFTPGIDVTYVDYEPNAVTGTTSNWVSLLLPGGYDENGPTTVINPLFKNSATLEVKDSSDTLIGYEKVTSDFCATFVLGIVNSPANTGCPIFIASRPQHTTVGGVKSYYTKVVCKYLHSTIYLSTTKLDGTVTYVNTDTVYNSWIILQENTSTDLASGILAGLTSSFFSQDILDVITEYTPTGALFIAKDSTGTNKLYRITCTLGSVTDLDGSVRQVLAPSIQRILLSVWLTSAKIEGLSNLIETISTDTYNIFVTTFDTVYRYSSATSAWSFFINQSNDLPYLNTKQKNGVLSLLSGGSYLKALSNFVLVQKGTTASNYVGLLGTEIGILFFDLKLVDGVFIAGADVARRVLYNSAKATVTDIKLVVNSPYTYAFTSAYASQIPRSYSSNKNYMRLVNTNSDLVTDVYYIKPDVESTSHFPYYVNGSSSLINSIPSSEQSTYVDTVLIDSEHAYSVISPEYRFRLAGFVGDGILATALSTTIAYRYYNPVITERILFSSNKLELTTLALSEFTHSFKVNLTSINTTGTPVGFQKAIIVSQKTVLLPGISQSKSSIICIDLSGKITLPNFIESLSDGAHLVFDSEFSGIIYTTAKFTDASPIITPTPATITDKLFEIVPHNLGRYPQVILDPSVRSQLNDIKHIDSNRLEISFTSSVTTTLSLI